MDEEQVEKKLTEEEREQLIQENEQRNASFLDLFREELVKAELSPKTIKRYTDNAAFYINEYLTYEEIVPMEQGPGKAFTFLDSWFERKCLWASEDETRKMATSIKRFYKVMMEHGLISEDDFDLLKTDIKAALAYL